MCKRLPKLDPTPLDSFVLMNGNEVEADHTFFPYHGKAPDVIHNAVSQLLLSVGDLGSTETG